MPLPPVVALEIGTTKTVALVGEMREDGNVMITGMGETPSSGVRKSEIVDLGNAICPVCGGDGVVPAGAGGGAGSDEQGEMGSED